MSRIVIDIETVAFPLDAFDEPRKTYLLRFAESEQEREETIQKLNLYPTTAQVITIGMYNPDSNRGELLILADEPIDDFSEDGAIHSVSGDESKILSRFWEQIANYHQIITFNGRGFDCPFLMMRSAILQVKPTRNLMTPRYDTSVHCDLLEQFTFYGAIRKFNLDFYCKAFGIDSPKSHGITGLDLRKLYEEKRFREIAEYCLGDLEATAELYRRWEKFLNL